MHAWMGFGRWVHGRRGSMGDDRLSQPSREMKVIFNLPNRTSTKGIRADLLFEPAVGRDHKGKGGGTRNRIPSLRMAPVHSTETDFPFDSCTNSPVFESRQCIPEDELVDAQFARA